MDNGVLLYVLFMVSFTELLLTCTNLVCFIVNLCVIELLSLFLQLKVAGVFYFCLLNVLKT